MITFVKQLPRPLCLVLLLCAAGCDQAWSSLAGPNGLKGATATMHDGQDGQDSKDDGSSDTDTDPTLPKIICCDCNGRTCTQPDEPEPPTLD